jgi:site-specific DNA-methyltransferase (adenine-specific)
MSEPNRVGGGCAWRKVHEIEGPDGIAATLYLGDCVEIMGALEPASVHSVVTDPPYELGFLGLAWDMAGGVASDSTTWARALALLRPGGHLTAFGGSRTYHRIACAIEDAGFEIRDQLMWIYGQGFPKSSDIAKCIDKRSDNDCAISDDARAWEGWGTALKPAHEPIAMARKPFKGAVAANCLAHGTGGLNIGATKVGAEFLPSRTRRKARIGTFEHENQVTPDRYGRWPANVLTDGSFDVLEALPPSARDAIRFFYCPKVDRNERDFGMDGGTENNSHPTVKPVDLMAWLCRLTTPAGGVVLDPFAGSGSTGIAAVRHGFRFIGIEQGEEYFDIACRRISAAVAAEAAMPRFEREIARAVQFSMFDSAGA